MTRFFSESLSGLLDLILAYSKKFGKTTICKSSQGQFFFNFIFKTFKNKTSGMKFSDQHGLADDGDLSGRYLMELGVVVELTSVFESAPIEQTVLVLPGQSSMLVHVERVLVEM